MKRHFLFVLTLVGATLVASAQENRYSQSDVDLQGLFIEAGREKLLGNYEKAEEAYQKVIEQDSDNDAAWYELARVLAEQDKDQEALRAIQKAVQEDEENVWYKLFLAEQFQRMGRDQDGAKVFEGLVKSYPDNEEYYFKWAFYLVRAGEIKQALNVYDQLEARMGINEEIVRRKHQLYVGSGDMKKAAAELQRLVDAFPEQVGYYELLAGFYDQINEEGQAREVYKQILELEPDNAEAKLAVAGAARESGGEATAFLNSLKPVFENPDVEIDVKIKEILPLIQQASNSDDRQLLAPLLELSRILVNVHPDEAKAHAAYADLLYYAGEQKEAIAEYERTLELDESVYLVWEQLLYIYHEQEAYDKLVETAESAMDIFPNQAKLYYLYGVGQTENGEYRDALSVLNQALLMSGRDGRLQFDIYTQMGKTQHAMGEYGDSNASFEKALELNADGVPALNAYSFALAERGENLAKAEEMIVKATKLVPNEADYQDTYAWVLYQAEKYSKAKQWAEKALQNGGNEDPEILERYGDILFQLGETELALENWKKAQNKGNDSEALERKIAERKIN